MNKQLANKISRYKPFTDVSVSAFAKRKLCSDLFTFQLKIGVITWDREVMCQCCHFVCKQDCAKASGRITVKLDGRMQHG